jgi:hypothetical protein
LAPLVSATGKSGRRHDDKGMRGRRPALAGASELASEFRASWLTINEEGA